MKWIVRQKFRFDAGIGHGFAFLNMLLLLVIASDKLQSFLGIAKTRWFIALAVPCGLVGIWLFGWFLDACGFIRRYTDEANARNEMLKALRPTRERSLTE